MRIRTSHQPSLVLFTSPIRHALFAAASVTALSITGATAQVFTTVPLSGVANARLQATWPTFTGVPYPEGNQNWGNVPWSLGSGGNNTWFSRDRSGPNPRSVTIPINVPQATEVFTLMGTWQGTTNQSLYVELEFTGSAGASFTTRFVGGVHIRDWFNGRYTNNVTSPNTTANVFSINTGPNGGSGTSRLDMQRIDLPAIFDSQSLSSMTVRDFGADPQGTFGQRSFIYGLTVNSIPNPSATALLGLAGLMAARRRRPKVSVASRRRASLNRPTSMAGAALVLCATSSSMAQSGSAFVDARSNIFGYGVTTPQPGGGGGGIAAITINLTPGTGRYVTFSNTGSARWSTGSSFNDPDGGNSFAGRTRTNIPAVGPISSYSAPRVGPLVGLFLQAESPVGLAAPASVSYPDPASLTAASFLPNLRQVFFIGDGLTGTGSGSQQRFFVPDTASRLVLGIADAGNFNGSAGFYNDNGGGYNVTYTVVPSISTMAIIGCGGVIKSRRRRVATR